MLSLYARGMTVREIQGHLAELDRIKQTMVGLKMPRAIEILDATVRRLERGEMTALEAIDALLAEECEWRSGSAQRWRNAMLLPV